MDIPSAVKPIAVKSNEEETGEHGPFPPIGSMGADNNDDQRLSEMLLAEEARLKAILALERQKMADLEVERAKTEDFLDLLHMDITDCLEKLTKEGKLQKLPSNLSDRILKYVGEEEMDKLKRDMELKLSLQEQQKFDKGLDQNTEKVKGEIKTGEKYVGKLEPQEEPKLLPKQSDKPVVAMATMRQQIRSVEKAVKRKAKKHGKATQQANTRC